MFRSIKAAVKSMFGHSGLDTTIAFADVGLRARAMLWFDYGRGNKVITLQEAKWRWPENTWFQGRLELIRNNGINHDKEDEDYDRKNSTQSRLPKPRLTLFMRSSSR